MMIDPQACYVKSHEWAKKDGTRVAVGLAAYAIHQLGDIVYMELPEIGRQLQQGATFGLIESVKSTLELCSPVSGRVVEVNSEVPNNPGVLAQDAYEKGWLIKLEPGDLSELEGLMDADAYRVFLETEA